MYIITVLWFTYGLLRCFEGSKLYPSFV
jgi:hypothetical protein